MRMLVIGLVVWAGGCCAAGTAELLKTEDIRIRDPFVLPVAEEGYYYLYGTGSPLGELGFDGYRSKDLKHWEGPFPVLRREADFWGNQLFWAPEVHWYRGKYYLFGTFDRKPGLEGKTRGPRGTQISVSDSPRGPFKPIGDRAHTPAEWEALDGTLFIDDDENPWMVFCHEWIQVGDGEVVAVRLKEDLSGTVGETHLLFRAGDAPWVSPTMHDKHVGKVTDGPCLLRMPDGSLVMLWSSFGKDRRYNVGVARSVSGDLLGPWEQDTEPLVADDGGHPMVFETFGGQKMLTFHRPNRHPDERAQFVPITLERDKVVLGEALPSTWRASPPLFLPGDEGAFDEVAVKDPSVVHHEGAWHVFYTARSDQGYSLGYVSAPSLEGLQDTERHPLPQLAGKREGYAAAPQVFFFAPQQKWYLVYQTRESNYQPVFSTTETLADPESWSPPRPLMEKGERAKWIDFWMIGDETRAWCFFTRNHTDVYGAHTSLEDFPSGWSAPERMFGPVHEAVHVYKVSGKDRWHMIYELREEDGRRSFGLATANHLGGPWEKVTDTFATGDMLQFPEGVTPWTEEVSHGEALRTGMDHRLEYDAEHPRLLIQGLRMEEHQGTYTNLPWRLGVVEKALN